MKLNLLLPLCLLLAGCNRPEQNDRELLSKLDAIKTELAAKRIEPVRWAFANKSQIESAVLQWSRGEMETFKKTENLSPDQQAKIHEYETLQSDLMHKQMEAMRLRMPGPRPLYPEPPVSDKDSETLAKEAAAAREPVADIIDRRNQQEAKYRAQYSAEKLIADYAKDRFDLIVDSGNVHLSNTPILYRSSGETLDITEGIIRFFKEKTKQ